MPTAAVLASDLIVAARRLRIGDAAMRTIGSGTYGLSIQTGCTGHGGRAHEHWTFSTKGVPGDDPFRAQVVSALAVPPNATTPARGYLQWVVFLDKS